MSHASAMRASCFAEFLVRARSKPRSYKYPVGPIVCRSLRHTAAWHHPAIDLTEPPEFSLVDDLVCLPLEEV
jgi:hypothetical protein